MHNRDVNFCMAEKVAGEELMFLTISSLSFSLDFIRLYCSTIAAERLLIVMLALYFTKLASNDLMHSTMYERKSL